ncbi:hypothetical protein [Haloquadratum walsbyi]|jgi:hypothetical protein|uniref:Cox cluster protein n=1 Tax=Haloquadratum walsbyi J07HQW2 TaxID=1238425 RepID=U1MWL1_9EURY|nr:hypothetical protein [Haloquadratum walsbyi]ERG94834.1 MAG: hypothetical protein J07HQW2_01276 [Haloquadratum walsbyi J07HQW2]
MSAEETGLPTSHDTNENTDTESTVTTKGSSTGDSMTQSESPQGQPGLGRQILLGLGGFVIILSAGIGWLVGSNAPQTMARTQILNMSVTIPTTPVSLSLYGIIVSTFLLSMLFGLVSIASRIEDNNDVMTDTDHN